MRCKSVRETCKTPVNLIARMQCEPAPGDPEGKPVGTASSGRLAQSHSSINRQVHAESSATFNLAAVNGTVLSRTPSAS